MATCAPRTSARVPYASSSLNNPDLPPVPSPQADPSATTGAPAVRSSGWVPGVALHLVRHGPPLIQPGRAASTWPLDPSRTSEVQQLLPVLRRRAPAAVWHSSDEPKAVATARLLTNEVVGTWPALREAHRSDWFATHEEFRAAVLNAFDEPSRSVRPGWEPLDETRRRISTAVADIRDRDGDELVLVGHGTAWTLLISDITGCRPDLLAWSRLRVPDLCTVDLRTPTINHPWGQW